MLQKLKLFLTLLNYNMNSQISQASFLGDYNPHTTLCLSIACSTIHIRPDVWPLNRKMVQLVHKRLMVMDSN